MDYEKQVQAITAYIKAGEKNKKDLAMGLEMEHFIINQESLQTVSYYGDDGVGSAFKDFENLGFIPEIENGNILNMQKDEIALSTEPGSQFEVAIRYNKSLRSLQEFYLRFFRKLVPYFAEKNQLIANLGYQPLSKIDDIKILPKKRYDYMYKYFDETGDMGHNMMKGTASLQCIIDYCDEDDFVRKYRLANCLSPILYALFDNAYIFEGSPAPFRNMREIIWENTDKDRSGMFEIGFDDDFSYRKYAEKILNTPIIFMEKDGEKIYTGKTPFKDLLEDPDDKDLIFHALSIVFPDVRVKSYIEIRMMDSIKYPLNFAATAFIKGLFYNDQNLEKMDKIFRGVDYKTALNAKKDSRQKGLDGLYMGQKISDLSKELVAMAKDGLCEDEKGLIKPLEDMLETGRNPRDNFEKIYKEDGLRAAILSNCPSLDDLNNLLK
ncbi:MAG: glutamate-cysteine ligase family protein [Finegoldia sp.]|nr:glutamate-cysteine ligase family protein [Finegoldia sp.]